MIYGYGIVDKTGYMWRGEDCVNINPQPMEAIVRRLNDRSDMQDFIPFRVVELTYWFNG